MIIAFTGKKHSGKSEASKCLKDFKDINFKDSLIEEVTENFPDLLKELSLAYRTADIRALFDVKPPLVRLLLQNYGTNVRRKDNENYWVDKWLNSIDIDSNVVADDVRFLNEAKAVKDSGGIVIRITRPGNISNDKHISETEMDKIEPDYEIINSSDKEYLYSEIKKIINGEEGRENVGRD